MIQNHHLVSCFFGPRGTLHKSSMTGAVTARVDIGSLGTIASWRVELLKMALAAVIGTLLAAGSAIWAHSTALTTYSDILDCEQRCEVAASGLPFPFIRDYPGMSVVNSASWTDVMFAADRFDASRFLGSALAWAIASYLTLLAGARLTGPRA